MTTTHFFCDDNISDIPSSVTHLTFGINFNQPIKNIIPSSVTHLTFGWDFDQDIIGAIPSSVTHLTFGINFNQNIKGAIPSSVTHLTFKGFFNQSIFDAIPCSVTHLTFGTSFNQNIKGAIPSSVTHLVFGDCFNQDIKNCIPSNIIYLVFGRKFNQPIKNAIPYGVTYLTFGSNFNQSITDAIPSSVTHLMFGWNFNQPIKDCIPSSVTHLTFGSNFNQPIKDAIPSSVTYLTFGYHFNQPIKDYIPSNVTHLTIGHGFNQPIKGAIPSNVTHLIFDHYNNLDINDIPYTVLFLKNKNKNIILRDNRVAFTLEKLKNNPDFIENMISYAKSILEKLQHSYTKNNPDKSTFLLYLINHMSEYPFLLDIIKEYIKANTHEINQKNINRINSFTAALNNSNISIIQCLLEHGANSNFIDNDSTLFLDYCEKIDSDYDIIELLIKYGADIDKINKNGNNALMLVLLSPRNFEKTTKIIELLLKSGINTEICNTAGRDIYDIIHKKFDNEKIIILLKLLLKYRRIKETENLKSEIISLQKENDRFREMINSSGKICG